nr:MAG TPA: hypothetical protein [Caudoviricetes sp.]
MLVIHKLLICINIYTKASLTNTYNYISDYISN